MIEKPSLETLERRPGVAVWRQIADRIRADIPTFQAESGGKLPSEADLAARFGVNRHTVRAALSALADQGLVRSQRGRGTFAIDTPRFSYPIGRRTRFSAAFVNEQGDARIELQTSMRIAASKTVADALEITEGRDVLMLDTRGMVGTAVLSFSTHWFDAERFEGLPEALMASGSITRALKACGVDDYTRRATLLSARAAGAHEAMQMDLSEGAILLINRATNVDENGKPIQYSETRFAADRVELSMDAQ